MKLPPPLNSIAHPALALPAEQQAAVRQQPRVTWSAPIPDAQLTQMPPNGAA